MPYHKLLANHLKQKHNKFHFFFVLIVASVISLGLVYLSFGHLTKAAIGTNGHLQYFGYWNTGGDGQDPFPLATELSDQMAYTNVSMDEWAFGPWPYSSATNPLAMAQAAGVKSIIVWPFWGTIDVGTGPDPAVFNSWVQAITPYINNIAAVAIIDEPDCNYNGATFPGGWTPENCRAMRLKIEANIAKLKSAFPNMPAWVNYTSAFMAGLPQPSTSEYNIPQNADWISWDCYTPWDNCFGSWSVPTVLSWLDAKLGPSQRAVFIPQAYQTGSTEAQVSAIADQYYNLALSDPKVIGIFPFIWWNPPGIIGAHDSPVIRAKYAQIGCAIKNGGAPCTSGGSDPIGVHDVSDCTATSGWTCDADNYGASLRVDFYSGPAGAGGTFMGSTTANVTREPAVGTQCGGNPNHGFVFNSYPAWMYDNTARDIYAYGINVGGGNNAILVASPKSVTCSSPYSQAAYYAQSTYYSQSAYYAQAAYSGSCGWYQNEGVQGCDVGYGQDDFIATQDACFNACKARPGNSACQYEVATGHCRYWNSATLGTCTRISAPGYYGGVAPYTCPYAQSAYYSQAAYYRQSAYYAQATYYAQSAYTPTDTTAPVVTAFDVQPRTTTGSVTISWTVTDSGGSFLSIVRLMRTIYNATDCNTTIKTGCIWTAIRTLAVPGQSNSWSSSVTDAPPQGTYFYGIQAVDNAGNIGYEPAPIQVVTTAPYSQSAYYAQSAYYGQSAYYAQAVYYSQAAYYAQSAYNAQSVYYSQAAYYSQSAYYGQSAYNAQAAYYGQSAYYAQSAYNFGATSAAVTINKFCIVQKTIQPVTTNLDYQIAMTFNSIPLCSQNLLYKSLNWQVSYTDWQGTTPVRTANLAEPTAAGGTITQDFTAPYTPASGVNSAVFNFKVGCALNSTSPVAFQLASATPVTVSVGTSSIDGGCGGGTGGNGGGTTQDIIYDIGKYNPLGGEKNILNVVILISTWIFNLALGIVTALIIYAGVRFLISRGNVGEVEQAKKMLWYILVGLAIVLIGKGIISLIASILG